MSAAADVFGLMQQLILNDDRRKHVRDVTGLPFGRARALRRVAALAGVTQKELGALIGSDAAYTTVIVDDLEQRGLVVREQHATDRRVKVVRCTPAGLVAAARVVDLLNEPPPSLVALAPDELATLTRLLTKAQPPVHAPAPAARTCELAANSRGGRLDP